MFKEKRCTLLLVLIFIFLLPISSNSGGPPGVMKSLKINLTGTGSGTVQSLDGAINCGSICSFSYSPGGSVTLKATPDQGSSFSGWIGCDSVSGNTCMVAMTAEKSATVTFTSNCAVILESDLSFHVPIVTFNGTAYWADFQYVPNTLDFNLTAADIVSDTTPFNGCTPATLSPDLLFQLPVLMFDDVSYWAALQYSHDIAFTLVGSGENLKIVTRNVPVIHIENAHN